MPIQRPLQNRVTPDGLIIATEARGLMMGNRGGAFHAQDKTLGRRRWASKQWICCRLEFKGRQREVMTPNRYTELFFLDEATALAAGHRPCFECRRQDALWFATLWARVRNLEARATAGEMDDILHLERVDDAGVKVVWRSEVGSLPSGTFVRHNGTPHLVLASWLLDWTPGGYQVTKSRPEAGLLDVLTPKSIVAVLSAGYCPSLHPSTKAS